MPLQKCDSQGITTDYQEQRNIQTKAKISNKNLKQTGQQKRSSLCVLHQNIQCLRNKTAECEIFLSSLEKFPDVVCLTEHWCTKDEMEVMNLEGYKLTSSFCRKIKIHGGSCIYVKKDAEISDFVDLQLQSVEEQCEVSAIVSKSGKLLILTVYRIPSVNQDDIDLFFNILTKTLTYCCDKYPKNKIVLCGDFNINLLDKNRLSSNFINLLLTFNLSQTIFTATRFSKKSESLIDNIFINFEHEQGGQVITSALSDHEAQILHIESLSKNEPQKESVRITKIFSASKLQQFKELLESETWEGVFQENAVNPAYNKFETTISNAIKLIFPPKNIKILKNVNKSWITTGIKLSSRRKRYLYNEMLANRITREYFNKYTKILKNVVKAAKQLSNKIYVESAQNKGKAVWDVVKTYTGKQKRDNESILENIQGESYKDILNHINDKFINQCEIIHSQNHNKENSREIPYSLFLQPSSPQEIFNIIKSLKNKKSVGEDEVPIKLLKHVADVICHPLSHIINLMLCKGIFPDRLKIAEIKALYKKGDKTDWQNYRPIALLSNISKIFEKCIYIRIINYVEESRLMSNSQYGFRKGKSTILAIYKALTVILDSLNNNKDTIAVCLDLSRAFDSVEHDFLLDKLENIGIRGVALQLIKSYLSDRYQQVVERDDSGTKYQSNKKIIKRGVPQGSVLGPLLYILYTNYLPEVVNHELVQFADDTSIIFSQEPGNDIKKDIIDAVNTLQNWFTNNNLQLNVNKTQIIKFSYQPQSEETILTCNNTVVTNSSAVKFLGIHLDSRLDWKLHVEKLAKNMSQYCYALRVVAHFVNMGAALTAYHAYIQSRVRYGVIFWGNSTDADQILKIQKKCLRHIFDMKPTDSCRDVFKNRNILTVVSLYIYEAAIFVKENSNMFHSLDHDHDTRKKKLLTTSKKNYTYIQKNVEYSLIKIYNKLPYKLKSLPINRMKYTLKLILLKKAYYTMAEYFTDNVLM